MPDKPTIGLNLDTLEREGAPEPFRFTLKGKVWTAVDPADVDWRAAVSLDETDLESVMKVYLGDRYADFAAIPLPQWKLRDLVEAIMEHYGASGEADAS